MDLGSVCECDGVSRNDDMVGYASICRQCGFEVTWANMYGMFTCPQCDYQHNPAFPERERQNNADWNPAKAVEARERRNAPVPTVQNVTVKTTATPWTGRWDEPPLTGQSS